MVSPSANRRAPLPHIAAQVRMPWIRDIAVRLLALERNI
jgi:hypothetical protein